MGTSLMPTELLTKTPHPGEPMADRAAPKSYSVLQIVLHWTIAALVVFQLLVNQDVQNAFKDRSDGKPFDGEIWAIGHITVGLTIFALAIFRLAIRYRRGVPEPHDTTPALVNFAAHAAHVLLYAFLFAMPLTGAIAWFTGLELSAELHELGRLILIPLILLHALGALAEHFLFHTNSLIRMLKSEPPDR